MSTSASSARDGTRGARGNRLLVGYVSSHLLAVIGEWAGIIGILVYAFEQGGARAAGLTSLATLSPYVLLASTTARLVHRFRPGRVRWIGLIMQALGYAVAAAAVVADAPVLLAAVGSTIALTAVTTLRPGGAVLLPCLVRDSRELIAANVRVGYCDSASALAGPLVATGLLQAGGPSAVLVGCTAMAALAVVAAAVTLSADPPAPPAAEAAPSSSLVTRLMRPVTDVNRLARRPAAAGVLTATTVQSLMIGAFDVLLVVIAGEELDLGDAGAGVLTTLFGIGALSSVLVSGRLVRRPRLGPQIGLAMVVLAVASAVLGTWMTIAVAAVVLPVCGISRTLLDQMSRVLLQRSAPPSELATVFGALETTSGVGMLAGSVVAQAAIALSGPKAGLLCVSAAYLLALAIAARRLRQADDGADVPVVEMSLLGRLPIFAAMPSPSLEAVARAAATVPVATGETLVRQGDEGDRYFAIVDGTFNVEVSGRQVRTLGRGDGFGEVALLADIARTATVTATSPASVLSIGRSEFLTAVTGHDGSHQAAWGAMHHLEFDGEIPTRRG